MCIKMEASLNNYKTQSQYIRGKRLFFEHRSLKIFGSSLKNYKILQSLRPTD